ncbi:cytidine deaminase [Oceanithermus sp.]|uniref:cytidine deaminase n=1 Tax=Oceanithermus sp. TaxID=2268145 RepID=UPI00257F5A8E|nr:cytidine deaminase [Oceanithermus sp.]
MPTREEIVILAQTALAHAYAPYSKFPVSAVVVAESGRSYVGVNVENGAYPLSRCAEQIAVGAMVAAGERAIREVLILSTSAEPATPCGACRQILAEFAGEDTPVVCRNTAGKERRFKLGELLPAAFRLEDAR